MYDAILIPTDGSESAVDAATHTYSLADRYAATVHVLAVAEQRESVSIVGQGDETLETLRTNGTEAMRRIVEEALSREIEATGAWSSGTPTGPSSSTRTTTAST